jgi:hypothetical protein
MRKMFTALATAAALLSFGATAAQASVAGKTPGATPACGSQCFELSSLRLGTHMIQNAYVHGDTGVGGRQGVKVNLHGGSNARPNEDFTGAAVGKLGQFCGTLIPAESYACLNYPGSYPVYESDWSPFGNQRDLCVGVAVPGMAGENVTLQPCGQSAATLWVGDMSHAITYQGNTYTPWVNAADPNFSHPLVLTVDTGSRHPWDQLKLQRLNLLSGQTVPDNQMFTLRFGPEV